MTERMTALRPAQWFLDLENLFGETGSGMCCKSARRKGSRNARWSGLPFPDYIRSISRSILTSLCAVPEKHGS